MFSGWPPEERDKNLVVQPGEQLRRILEDFEVLGLRTGHGAIIARDAARMPFRLNVLAAVIASGLGLSSVDYARKKYIEELGGAPELPDDTLYKSAYRLAKAHIEAVFARLKPEEDVLPTHGEFGASVVLERLRSSLFSAHLLYSLGCQFEGHAVSRLALEQIAWAYSAAPLERLEDIQALRTTKCVSALDLFFPGSGRLYGRLSKLSHIDYDSHPSFLDNTSGQNTIMLGLPPSDLCADTILFLADAIASVWEFSQRRFLETVDSIEFRNGATILSPDRPFVGDVRRLRSAWSSAAS